MNIVLEELKDIRNHCESSIHGTQVITCVPSLVQISITKTKFKQLSACIQFPTQYPNSIILIELKSHTLSDKLLKGLTKLCEEKCKQILGKSQVLRTIEYLCQFLEENPLCVCNDEIFAIKRILDEKDELKLKLRSSNLTLTVCKDLYFLKTLITVPNLYPEKSISIENKECNFPPNFQKWFIGQASEIARQHVEKSLKPNSQNCPFVPKPSLWPAVAFLIQEVKRYPSEICRLCKNKCFPENPMECPNKDDDKKHIERLYCGHIYHNDCLKTFMKTPPFSGGKKCLNCKQRIYHEKWKTTPQLAENRWAHQEAKKRELEVVMEFFE